MQIPQNTPDIQGMMSEWYTLAEELKKVRAKEMLLRQAIFEHYFKEPKEGTNSADLPDGFVIKGVHKITRNVDQGSFDALKEKMIELKISPDVMVEYKPELKLKNYRALNEEQVHLFDQCLIIKPGSPSLEIVKPKRA